MKAGYLTHVGLRRSSNQDCICYVKKNDALLAIVCDGIGGGLAGDVASKMACMHMKDRFLQMDSQQLAANDISAWIKKGIQEANDLIFVQSKKVPEMDGMGTTITGVMIVGDQHYVFNAGDSRVYTYGKSLKRLTVDHTFVESLVQNGEISKEEALIHPMRNTLVNAVGIWDQVQVDITKVENQDQGYLICSDGLHGYVEEAKILALLTEKDVDKACNNLLQAALDAGGYDNISLIVLAQEEAL